MGQVLKSGDGVCWCLLSRESPTSLCPWEGKDKDWVLHGPATPQLIQDCHTLLNDEFIFQQDGAPAHTAQQTQDWLQQQCAEFIKKDEWPPNSPDLNPLDYFVWSAMLQSYEQVSPKPTTVAELSTVLQDIFTNLHQQSIDNAILSLRKRVKACIQAEGGTSNTCPRSSHNTLQIGPFQVHQIKQNNFVDVNLIPLGVMFIF